MLMVIVMVPSLLMLRVGWIRRTPSNLSAWALVWFTRVRRTLRWWLRAVLLLVGGEVLSGT